MSALQDACMELSKYVQEHWTYLEEYKAMIHHGKENNLPPDYFTEMQAEYDRRGIITHLHKLTNRVEQLKISTSDPNWKLSTQETNPSDVPDFMVFLDEIYSDVDHWKSLKSKELARRNKERVDAAFKRQEAHRNKRI